MKPRQPRRLRRPPRAARPNPPHNRSWSGLVPGILLGRIAGVHGIRGEVLIHSYAEVPEDIGAYGPLSDAAGARSFAHRKHAAHQQRT